MRFQDQALLTIEERSDYIRTAAAESGLSELIIEKDFWVVWLLEQLFALSQTVGPFTFKGGTSLSKGFRAIQRFSEDIDISIGRATLGFPDEGYFYETPSAKETKRRVEQIRNVVSWFESNFGSHVIEGSPQGELLQSPISTMYVASECAISSVRCYRSATARLFSSSGDDRDE
jgi:hypothetical protein